MADGSTDEREIRVFPAIVEHRRQSPPRLHRPQETASLPIPDELLLDIFLCLSNPADLVRASAACVSFRRLVADRYFLRRYRKLHAPPLLGFVERRKVFRPVVAPHRSASAANAVALAADFSFSFLPAPASDWVLRDILDGRVLLCKPMRVHNSIAVFPEVVVCDPLHRRYLLLPPITYDLAASVEDQLLKKTQQIRVQIFFVPPGDSEETTTADETSFSVIWMAQCKTRLVAFVFSSNTQQWRSLPSRRWSELSADLPPLIAKSLVHSCSRQYVYGCFYWVICYREEIKLLVLDTKTMEFSIAEPPPEANGSRKLGMVEAAEGRPGMLLLVDDTCHLSYFIRQSNGGSSSQWQKVKTILLDFGTLLICNMGKSLLLYQPQSSLLEAGGFTLDIKTFQLEKVCALGSSIYELRAYSNFPPSLLSSPTISNGIQEDAEKPMLEQDSEVLPAEAHSHQDQNTFEANAGGQAVVGELDS